VILAILAVRYAWTAYSILSQFGDCFEAVSAEVTVDLSKPGVIETPWRHTCDIAHGQAVYLNIAGTTTEPYRLIASLVGRIDVFDSAGVVVASEVITEEPARWLPWRDGEPAVCIAYMVPFKRGEYMMRLTVIDPAPALADSPQRVTVRYDLCGCEVLGGYWCAFIAGVSGLPALIIGSFTTIGLIRHGLRRAPKKSHADPVTD
jgi:hypothetical protein